MNGEVEPVQERLHAAGAEEPGFVELGASWSLEMTMR